MKIKKVLKNNVKLVVGLVIGLIISIGTVKAYLYAASGVPFSTTDNTSLQKKLEDLYTKTVSMVTYRNEICPGCVYRKSTTEKHNVNSSSGSKTAENIKLITDEYTTDYTTLNSNFFLGHVIDNDGYILSSYVCGINNETFFCLKGVDSDQSSLTYKPFYQEAVNRINKVFPECNANTSSSFITCIDEVNVSANSNGNVKVSSGSSTCFVNPYGRSYCF